MEELYQAIIIEESKNPQNFGDPKECTLHGSESSASCGDVIHVGINLDKQNKKIKKIVWNGSGCSIATASMSLFSSSIIGEDKEKVLKADTKTLLSLLGLKQITLSREKCMMVGLRAIRQALTVKEN